jgi:hypothetical protein
MNYLSLIITVSVIWLYIIGIAHLCMHYRSKLIESFVDYYWYSDEEFITKVINFCMVIWPICTIIGLVYKIRMRLIKE